MPRKITPHTTLENLKREAKRWLKALGQGDVYAHARLARVLPSPPASPVLRDVQHALAREHDLPGWTALAAAVSEGSRATSPVRQLSALADALLAAYLTGEQAALETVWQGLGHQRPLDGMRRSVRVDLGLREHDDVPITRDDARGLVARAHGFASWSALEEGLSSLAADAVTVARRPVRAFERAESRKPAVVTRDWNAAIDAIDAQQLTRLSAEGETTDAMLDRVSYLSSITSLDLEGSKALSEAGFAALTRMPQLRELRLGGTAVTDAALSVVRQLPALERIDLAGTRVTDAGVAHLAACERLTSVSLMHTHTGDGAVRALAGKERLADFRSGAFVTDAGVGALRDFPVFRSWQGGEVHMSLTGFDAKPNYLMLRGSFGDRGLATLAGLHGLFALNVDDASLPLTGASLAPLLNLPHLGWLAFDAKDDGMPYIARMPSLRFLMCQDTSAGDDGFTALGKSQSIEYIWGRRCHGLRDRGFGALSRMPSLRALSVSCLNVSDSALAALPSFPALRELMPMDIPDEGYRHIGACSALESLVLMYCRDTTDRATEHIAGLPRLSRYFASYTQVTDRTPELLAGIESLERIGLSNCHSLTNAGIAALARLPRLHELDLGGMPGVTPDVRAAFSPGVQVDYSP